MDRIRFGVFDHIEHLPGVSLTKLYADRLTQMEALDEAGFFAYHLAEHHTPAVHSMAPSQNVFLCCGSGNCTEWLRFGVRRLRAAALYHPLRPSRKSSMPDHLLWADVGWRSESGAAACWRRSSGARRATRRPTPSDMKRC